MLKAFSWMFKKEEFKKHYLYLFLSTLLLSVIGLSLNFCPIIVNTFSDKAIILTIVSIILISIGFLLPIGYFWDLAEKIIDGRVDLILSETYNSKKTKRVLKFDMPKFNFPKHIWRGIASILATLISTLPFGIIIFFAVKNGTLTHDNPQIGILAIILFCLLLPGLLWNYAKTNSITAIFNIPKAINLIGNYLFRYVSKVFLLVIVLFANSSIDLFFTTYIKSKPEMDTVSFILILIVLPLILLKNTYIIYVNAYLLGTIAPAENI